MKVTVHTLIHAEAGIIAQVIEFEGKPKDVDKELSKIIGFDFTDDADYEVDVMIHNEE